MTTIRPLHLNDQTLFPEALEILNRLQGRGLFPPHYLADRARDPESFIVAAFDGELLVGAAVAQVLANLDYQRAFGEDVIAELQNRRVGYLATMAVHEEYHRRGLGRRMSEARLEWLSEKNCEVVLGVSWVSGLKGISAPVFEHLGFTAVARREDFYVNGSIARGFVCPACGGPPCRCPAILYRKNLV